MYVCIYEYTVCMYASMYCSVHISWRRDLNNRTQEWTEMAISVCVYLKKGHLRPPTFMHSTICMYGMYVCICTEYKPRGIEIS